MATLSYKIILVAVLVLGIYALTIAQLSIPTLFGADGYLHIRMAKFLCQYGIIRNFHWARYSTFAEQFADKDLLYHFLLIPFTFFPDIFRGAKIASLVFAIFLYLVYWQVLRKYCHIKWLTPFFLIIFFCSAPFLHALSRTRNMILVMALTLIFIHFLIKKKPWPLFFLTVIYSLSHVSGPLLLVIAFLGEFSRFISEGRFLGKNIWIVALGLLTGYLIHPHFPNNLLNFYLNGILVPIFALKWGLELGAEFFPISMRDFVLDYPFILISLLILACLGMSQQNTIKTSTRMWVAIAGFFFVFSFFSQRYILHSYPLVLVSLAAYLSDWCQAKERMSLFRQKSIVKAGLVLAVLIFFCLIGLRTYKVFQQRALNEFVYNRHYEAAGKWLAQNIPQGEVIFHSNWSDSQYLIGINPQNDYFVTFDPIYMYYWNPQKYNLYRDISFGRTDDPYNLLRKEFGVNYGYVGKNYFGGLINQIRKDSRFEVLAEDNLGLIFHLKPGT
jgi:hypothetical protein